MTSHDQSYSNSSIYFSSVPLISVLHGGAQVLMIGENRGEYKEGPIPYDGERYNAK